MQKEKNLDMSVESSGFEFEEEQKAVEKKEWEIEEWERRNLVLYDEEDW